jgi:hypothetical protein
VFWRWRGLERGGSQSRADQTARPSMSSGVFSNPPASSSSMRTEAGRASGTASESTRSQESRDTQASDFVNGAKTRSPDPSAGLCV